MLNNETESEKDFWFPEAILGLMAWMAQFKKIAKKSHF